MSYCGKCGTQIPDGASFCPSCGNPVAQGVQQNGSMGNDKSRISGDHFKTVGKKNMMSFIPQIEISSENGLIGYVEIPQGIVGEMHRDFVLVGPDNMPLLNIQHMKSGKAFSTARFYSITDKSGNGIGEMEIHERKATLKDVNGNEFNVNENLSGREYKIHSKSGEVAEIKHHLASKYFEGNVSGDIDRSLFVSYLLYRTLLHAMNEGSFYGGPMTGGPGFRI